MYLLRPSTPAHVCTSCTRRLLAAVQVSCRGNGTLLTPRGNATTLHNAYSTTTTSRKPLRLAIIGSGPAGFYTAYRLMRKVQDAVIDMYEQLPVPYGLVRFGVAPDHPEVKNCQDTFEEVALSPRFNYIGNVCVGKDVALSQMKPHYDAVLFSYGASEDKKLDVPGEDTPGVYSAREFVGWYNGLPQFQGLKPQLDAGQEAVIIGQGNVAMDLARILLSPVESLSKTDITEEALQTLSDSKVKSVTIVGRRGPLQAAFTVKEARELMNIPLVSFKRIPTDLYPGRLTLLPRVPRRIAEVLYKGTPIGQPSNRSWALEFLKAPKSINAQDNHVSSVTFTKQKILHEQRLHLQARPRPTDEEETLKASLVFRSIGYKATPLLGLSSLNVPFDNKLGIIPNDVHGRVISPSQGPGNLTAGHVPGIYCAGWVKRGPTGVIASTMQDAFASADIIAQDWEANVPFLNTEGGESKRTHLGWDGIKEAVIAKGIQPLSWKDWKVIDKAERERGKKKGKEREKFRSVEEMLKVLND